MHTVELLLDPGLEHGVRELWTRLHDAGLPSLAAHGHPTNRPHLTVVTATSLVGLPLPLPLPLSLPLAAGLGPVRMLGRALVRPVTPTADLSDLQARTYSLLSGADPWPPPPDWVPHVSLALRVPESRRAAALELLADVPPAHGRFVAARTYDTGTRTVTHL